jgi:putative ABC transport system permease protein
MWKNYLLVAARTLAASKRFTAINLLGLAVGMASCVLIAMWVRTELTFDRWMPDAPRIFVVNAITQYPGKPLETWGHSATPMLPKLREFFPQTEAGSRLIKTMRTVRQEQGGNPRVENQTVTLVDPDFFKVLALPVLRGEAQSAIARPDQLVVSEAFATRWFGRNEAVGQRLTVAVKGEARPYTVAAVLADLPANSMFDFELIMPLVEADFVQPQMAQNWGNFNAMAVVKLKDVAEAASINARMDDFVRKFAPDFEKLESGFYYRPQLRPLTDQHLQKVAAGALYRPPGDPQWVAALAATGVLILLIAIITYVNLATARVSVRAREVGLRKTLGASRAQLLQQFLCESLLLAALAGVVALAIIELTLPAFNALLGQRLALSYGGADGVLWPLLAMVAMVGAVGGWYPALVMTRLPPREAINGRSGAGGNGRLRQLLVVGQFAIAMVLITMMVIVFSQVRFLRSADMGYEPASLIVISQLSRAEVAAKHDSLLAALRRVPGVVSVTRSLFDPTSSGLARRPAYLPGVPDAAAPTISPNPVDWDYVQTYGARLLAGRDLNVKFGNDDWPDLPIEQLMQRGGNALINRAALSFFNTTDPAAVIGRTFQIGGPSGAERITVTVVGVVEDIRMRAARTPVLPSFYARDVSQLTSASVRYSGVPTSEMTERLQGAWRTLFPATPFAAQPVDEAVANYYKAEARRGQMFALFAGIAIVLCAVGLYGLAVFTSERRTKEIGIRKILGASAGAIMRLLVWQFSVPVLIAMAIAWPLAWWMMRDWLNSFDLRIALTATPFLVTGLAALLIAWLTVGWHAYRVARASPIHALRHE